MDRFQKTGRSEGVCNGFVARLEKHRPVTLSLRPSAEKSGRKICVRDENWDRKRRKGTREGVFFPSSFSSHPAFSRASPLRIRPETIRCDASSIRRNFESLPSYGGTLRWKSRQERRNINVSELELVANSIFPLFLASSSGCSLFPLLFSFFSPPFFRQANIKLI